MDEKVIFKATEHDTYQNIAGSVWLSLLMNSMNRLYMYECQDDTRQHFVPAPYISRSYCVAKLFLLTLELDNHLYSSTALALLFAV
jgi:hypothetical protein